MKNISVNEVPENIQLIDVRETDEFAEVRAKGAKNIPLSEFIERHHEIDDEQPVYVICKAGGRSMQAAQYMEQALGIEEVFNVDGGTDAWVAQNLPTDQ
jgi:rhodanese-related sulfurtransferase